MRKLKFRFWKDKKLQGILELKNNNILDMAWEWDTVNQFTGLLDKSGVEIYEGDIANITMYITDKKRTIPGGEYAPITERGLMKFNIKNAQFSFEIENSIIDEDNSSSLFIEVIGNIYENPELLTK
jgi:uncharacterized phage protein (TIGR01671 family)